MENVKKIHYEKNGKIELISIPLKELNNLMKKLDIEETEAIEIWLSDNDIIQNEEIEELTKKAKDSGIMKTIHEARRGRQKGKT